MIGQYSLGIPSMNKVVFENGNCEVDDGALDLSNRTTKLTVCAEAGCKMDTRWIQDGYICAG